MEYKNNNDLKDVLEEIAKAIKSIKFGQVQIIIHNSQVVQIDKIEKFRFENEKLNDKKSFK